MTIRWHSRVASHGRPPRFRESRRLSTCAELIDFHNRLMRKWEYAAARPWLSVDSDPPPPNE